MNATPTMPEDQAPPRALRRWLLVFASIATCGALAAIALYWSLVVWGSSLVSSCLGQTEAEAVQILFDEEVTRIMETAPVWWAGLLVTMGVGLVGALVVAIVQLAKTTSTRRVAHGVLLASLVASMVGAGWSTHRLQKSSTSLITLTPFLCSTATSEHMNPDEVANAVVLMSGQFPRLDWPHRNTRTLSIVLALSGSSGLIWLAATRRPRIRKAPPAL